MKRKLQLGVERKDRAGLAVPTKRSVRLRPHRVAEEEKIIRMRKAWEEAIEKVAENSPFSSKNNPSEPTVLTEGAMGRLQSGSIYRGQHPPENPVIGDMYINALDMQFVYTDEGERDGWHRAAVTAEPEQQQCSGCRYWRRRDAIELGGGVRTTFVFGTCTCDVNLPDGSTTEGEGMHENETGCPNWVSSSISTAENHRREMTEEISRRVAEDLEDTMLNGTPRACDNCEHFAVTETMTGLVSGGEVAVGECRARENSDTRADNFCDQHSRVTTEQQIYCGNCQHWTETSRGSLTWTPVPMGRCSARWEDSPQDAVCHEHELRSVLTPVPTTNGGRYIRHPVSNQILMTDGRGNEQWVDPPQASDEPTVTLRGNGQVSITDRNGNPLPVGTTTQVDLTIPEQVPAGAPVLVHNDEDERFRARIDDALERAQDRMDKAIEETTSEFFAKARVRLLKFVWQFMLVITSIVGVSMYLAEKLT